MNILIFLAGSFVGALLAKWLTKAPGDRLVDNLYTPEVERLRRSIEESDRLMEAHEEKAREYRRRRHLEKRLHPKDNAYENISGRPQ